ATKKVLAIPFESTYSNSSCSIVLVYITPCVSGSQYVHCTGTSKSATAANTLSDRFHPALYCAGADAQAPPDGTYMFELFTSATFSPIPRPFVPASGIRAVTFRFDLFTESFTPCSSGANCGAASCARQGIPAASRNKTAGKARAIALRTCMAPPEKRDSVIPG